MIHMAPNNLKLLFLYQLSLNAIIVELFIMYTFDVEKPRKKRFKLRNINITAFSDDFSIQLSLWDNIAASCMY